MFSLDKTSFWLVLVVFILSTNTNAQLGFCNGNSGDPIFTEDFGTAPSAATQHVPLATSQTSYTFLGTNPSQNDFGDGKYTVTNFNYQQWDWFNEPDHTIGDANGRMLVVNASFTPGEFYRTTITGLCENTTYEFSAWLKNLTPRNSTNGTQTLRPCNVKFEIWNSTNSVLLKSGNTGDFYGSLSSESGEWIPSGLVFQTQVAQNSVILKMVNNGVGGFGNDVAIDDIVFKTCGDFIAISDSFGNKSISICSAQTPYTSTFNVTPDNSVFSSHFYQWERSTNGVDWTNVSGETNQNITVSGITTTSYYRTKVAESAVNLNNTSCNVVSDIFKVTVNPTPTKPSKVNCWDDFQFDAPSCSWINKGMQDTKPPNVNCWDDYLFNTTSCSWVNNGAQDTKPSKVNCWDDFQFDAPSCSWINKGMQDTKPPNVNCWDDYLFNTTSCSWVNNGVQDTKPSKVNCWDNFEFDTPSCSWINNGTQAAQPANTNCWDDYQFNTTSCSWVNNGAQDTKPSKVNCWDNFEFDVPSCAWINNGTQAAQPANTNCWDDYQFDTASCAWTNKGTKASEPTLECWEVANFNNTTCGWEITSTPPTQLIESVVSEKENIIVNTSNLASFEYSLDGINFQSSNIFINVPVGFYTLFIKQENCLNTITAEHQHIHIPSFFSPNGDRINDTFNLKGIENFSASEVYIFDRYGKVLKSAKNTSFLWNGTYNGAVLPNSDYWYLIIIEGKRYTGHFTLLRN